ncbi:MAG: hypothetical protein ACK4FV_01640 [Candidatus Nitrosocaldus sp.]
MIEALIVAAALAGAVTTLVRRSRSIERDRDRDEMVHDRTLPSGADGITDIIQEHEGKEGRMQKSVEHRIRSMADIRLKKYLHAGRIGEEEYRALAKNATVSTSSMDDTVRIDSNSNYNDSKGNDNNSDYSLPHHSKEKSQNDTIIMQEILLRLDRLNSRLDVLEGKIYANMNQQSIYPYTNPVIPTQGQENLHIKRYKSKDGSRIKRQGLRRGNSSMEGKGKDAITTINMNRDESYGHGSRDEERGDAGYDNMLIVDVDDVDNPPMHVKDAIDIGIGREERLSSIHKGEDGLIQGDNNKGSSNSNSITANSINASNHDSYVDEELESIKKQIMDAIARLEKNE